MRILSHIFYNSNTYLVIIYLIYSIYMTVSLKHNSLSAKVVERKLVVQNVAGSSLDIFFIFNHIPMRYVLY